jgi:hypothetical protein
VLVTEAHVAVYLQLSHRRASHPLRVPNDVASGERSASGSHAFVWRDAMDILVRWRQLSEPNDQVCRMPTHGYMHMSQSPTCNILNTAWSRAQRDPTDA